MEAKEPDPADSGFPNENETPHKPIIGRSHLLQFSPELNTPFVL